MHSQIYSKRHMNSAKVFKYSFFIFHLFNTTGRNTIVSAFQTYSSYSKRSFVGSSIIHTSRLRPCSQTSIAMKVTNNKGHNISNQKLPNVNKKPSIGIIGGGIAGLSCATHLAKSSSSSTFSQITVFDTGRLRPGGRCSSRFPQDKPGSSNVNTKRNTKSTSILANQLVDHAAQILTVSSDSNSPFSQQVQNWEEDGLLTRYPENSIFSIQNSAQQKLSISPISGPPGTVMYYGTNGMGSIPKAMAAADGFKIEQDVWVSPSNGVKYLSNQSRSNNNNNNQPNPSKNKQPSGSKNATWRIKAKGQILGDFNQIVIAHNGKCADRLMSQTPAKKLHSLLRTNFSPTVPSHGGKRMTLNSIYSLTVALPKDVLSTIPSDLISGFITNHKDLRFLSCNTRKFSSSTNDSIELWTILSSPKFAKQHKGPQENLPSDTVDEVTYRMLHAVEQSFHLQKGILVSPPYPKEQDDRNIGNLGKNILESKLQLWGAAVPLNTWNSPSNDSEDDTLSSNGFLYDSKFGVGACGDWLLESSIEGAWESGRRLAEWILQAEKEKNNSNNKDWSVGLPPNGSFQASSAVSKAGIGSLETK